MSSKRLGGQWNLVALATIVLLAFSFAFGGASRVNALRLALVELAALPLFVLALNRLALKPADLGKHKLAFGLLAAAVALPLLQLIPLPPAIWTRLPGRETVTLALELAGMTPGWAPLSLTPVETWGAALALIPPVAVFIALVAGQDGGLARRGLLVLLGFTMVNLVVGALQMATEARVFYPYQSTATGFVTGLFANRNHFATLILVAMPFGAALAGRQITRTPQQFWLYVFLFAGGMVAAMLALLAAQSRAGVILFLPSLLLSIVIAWTSARLPRPKIAVLAACGALVVGVLGVGATFLPPILDRYDAAEGRIEARFERWPIAVDAGEAYLPVGSGIGSFDPVFRTVEPLEQLDPTFFNHAHNEYLEIWIETGWIGLVLVALFLFWWGRRSWDAWFVTTQSDRFVRRAASAAILIMLVHSAVDYPLRTEAIAVVLALAAAILEGAGLEAPRSSSRKRLAAND